MIIDTHSHYNIEPLFSGKSEYLPLTPGSPLQGQTWRDHWRKAQEEGVRASIVVGVDVATSQRALQIASMETHVHAAVGIHPEEMQKFAEKIVASEPSLSNLTSEQTSEITQLLNDLLSLIELSDKPLVAIGEIGLDYFRLPDDPFAAKLTKQAQKICFTQQLKLARQLNLPAILHVRDQGDAAYEDTLAIVKANWKPGKPFVLHCVSGSVAYAQAAVELGAYIGVAGNVTYPSATAIRDIVAAVPHDRILSETDSPFLAPQGHRGGVCEPWMIAKTVGYLETLGISPAELAHNAHRLFGI